MKHSLGRAHGLDQRGVFAFSLFFQVQGLQGVVHDLVITVLGFTQVTFNLKRPYITAYKLNEIAKT